MSLFFLQEFVRGCAIGAMLYLFSRIAGVRDVFSSIWKAFAFLLISIVLLDGLEILIGYHHVYLPQLISKSQYHDSWFFFISISLASVAVWYIPLMATYLIFRRVFPGTKG